ncbi:MAG: hypothetical protein WD794_06670 [Mycobacteriales bacterium]
MLLVDAANVVGSRPDGWWHDRAGAAGRLVEQLRSAVREERLDPPVLVVLEGAARPGCPEGTAGGVHVVHAAGSGDDTLHELARSSEPVTLVSADRELGQRVRACGADVVGPGWLLDRLA